MVTFGKESWSDLSERCKRMSTSAVCKERVIGRAREQLLVGGGLPQKGGGIISAPNFARYIAGETNWLLGAQVTRCNAVF